MKLDLTRACPICPFRRDVPPGLGAWNPQDLLHAITVEPVLCFRTVRHEGQSLDDPALQACAGAALFLNATRERSEDPVTARYQDRLERSQAQEEVFRSNQAFIDHHNQLGKVPDEVKTEDE